MPKPSLKPEYRQLESDVIQTLIAGLKEWRPDLYGPESMSDYQACFRGLLKMYELRRRPIGIGNKDIEDQEE
jgi:hypothetical protein